MKKILFFLFLSFSFFARSELTDDDISLIRIKLNSIATESKNIKIVLAKIWEHTGFFPLYSEEMLELLGEGGFYQANIESFYQMLDFIKSCQDEIKSTSSTISSSVSSINSQITQLDIASINDWLDLIATRLSEQWSISENIRDIKSLFSALNALVTSGNSNIIRAADALAQISDQLDGLDLSGSGSISNLLMEINASLQAIASNQGTGGGQTTPGTSSDPFEFDYAIFTEFFDSFSDIYLKNDFTLNQITYRKFNFDFESDLPLSRQYSEQTSEYAQGVDFPHFIQKFCNVDLKLQEAMLRNLSFLASELSGSNGHQAVMSSFNTFISSAPSPSTMSSKFDGLADMFPNLENSSRLFEIDFFERDSGLPNIINLGSIPFSKVVSSASDYPITIDCTEYSTLFEFIHTLCGVMHWLVFSLFVVFAVRLMWQFHKPITKIFLDLFQW